MIKRTFRCSIKPFSSMKSTPLLPASRLSGRLSLLGRRCFGGFTLIELLTVIAIIGILAAILIPVTLTVRTHARATQSRSNLRQIALAHQSYETDRGSVPPLTNFDESGRSWSQRLAPYVGLTKASFIVGENPPGIFALPGIDEPVEEKNWGTYQHYARNMVFTQTTEYVTQKPNPEGSINRLADVRTPSITMLVGEWKPKDHWLTWAVNIVDSSPGVNGGRYAFAFVDGHVESFKAGQVPTQHDRTDPTYRAYFWDPGVSVIE